MADGRADALEELDRRLKAGTARVGVIGLGYVGVPLACAFVRQSIATTGPRSSPSGRSF